MLTKYRSVGCGKNFHVTVKTLFTFDCFGKNLLPKPFYGQNPLYLFTAPNEYFTNSLPLQQQQQQQQLMIPLPSMAIVASFSVKRVLPIKWFYPIKTPDRFTLLYVK